MSDNNAYTTTASQWTFLSHLHRLESHTKVRFLCCVQTYDEDTALLSVEHRYPPGIKSHYSEALVDLRLVLESVKRETVQCGAWINVVGYVVFVQREGRKGRGVVIVPMVQALLVWDAGAVRVDRYENVLREHLAMMQACQNSRGESPVKDT